jgi:formate dehydrogenase major subunit
MRITINGKSLEAEQGQTVLEIARENGIYIPALCYHPKTGRAAKCRACVVEIEGMRGLQTSCTLEARDGMKVVSNSPLALEAQRMVVDLLLSTGTHDCISCERNGNCELQEAAYYLGIEHPSFRFAEEKIEVDDSAEFIFRDHSKCIKCGRCVVGCQEVVVNKVLDFGFRANNTRVICDDNKPMGESSCVQCGECVQLCPVGALIEKKSIGIGRSWELTKVRTTCPYCGVGCQLDLHMKDEQIVRVTGVEDAEPNKGRLCIKGRFGYDFIYSQDRLTTPLIKENGEFREASWDEAIDLVADRFKQIIAESGPDALGAVSCARSINEDSYQMQKLFRAVFKTNNIDHCART